MKSHRIIAFALLLMTCFPLAHEHQSDRCALDNIDLDLKGETICIRERNKLPIERVEIDADYRIYINGEKLRLTPRQRQCARRYHQAAKDLLTAADRIQRDGNRMEARANELESYIQMKLALAFVDRGKFPLMQAYLENHESEIEDQINSLRKQADRIREKVDILADTHDSLRASIPQIDDLGWF